jgi:alkyl sulfatase BDS1-like metallo-beta-lactamase superfamily hydrolase
MQRRHKSSSSFTHTTTIIITTTPRSRSKGLDFEVQQTPGSEATHNLTRTVHLGLL